ncbi:adenosylcobinamide-GDP ribazoletransferase [Amorphus coralli]|uniref:adenosylcobinamide-GDP ribazoletransferase n=1 Tax=Amorphus coralli TaxID=340680 RepID=UPI0003648DF9|nr:adenosylcobinamide-GDP ribazoletransferase [Amorphus coralli]
MSAQDAPSRSLDPLGAYAADVVVCLRFFSRLALALPRGLSDLAGRRRLVGAVRALPVASLVIALPAAVVLAVLTMIGLPPLASAGVALAVLAITTGALHEDGLADVCDGFFGGREPEQRLTIMRDSRTGAFGALGLALTVLVRASLLAALADDGPLAAAAGLMAAAAASRTAMLWPWMATPPARNDGLARLVGHPDRKAVLLAAATAAAIFVLLTIGFAPLAVLPATLAVVGAAWLLTSSATRLVGGHTGDVLGATQQVAEIAVLATIAISVT